MPSRYFALLALLTTACGGGPSGEAQRAPASAAAAARSPAAAAAPASAPEPSAAPAAAPLASSAPQVPSTCARSTSDFCMPPGQYVERLCAKPRQEVALALFAKASPFTRLYLRGRIDELAFDEEVLALRVHRPAAGGMVVGSGKGTVDVLRWDGTCATGIEAEMFTRVRPPHPREAHVRWVRLGDRMQTALVTASDAVKRAHARRGKECQGAMMGEVSAACEKADAALVEAVVDYVRSGRELPPPEDP